MIIDGPVSHFGVISHHFAHPDLRKVSSNMELGMGKAPTTAQMAASMKANSVRA